MSPHSIDHSTNGPPAPDTLPPSYIAIVDDDEPVRQTIVDILEEEGFHVIPAPGGHEALTLLDTMDLPDVIVVD